MPDHEALPDLEPTLPSCETWDEPSSPTSTPAPLMVPDDYFLEDEAFPGSLLGRSILSSQYWGCFGGQLPSFGQTWLRRLIHGVAHLDPRVSHHLPLPFLPEIFTQRSHNEGCYVAVKIYTRLRERKKVLRYQKLSSGSRDHPGRYLVLELGYLIDLDRPGGSHHAIGLRPLGHSMSTIQHRKLIIACGQHC